ncbi:J domain-containing protein [Citrus sinensis]|uniref:J domain-containing protein n=1 Tax=Citrus sinensis TaxID=2711 RepID=A0ACB8MFT2_CITSI|nr:J domain-containing protein [Citrus sinensis]
MQAQLLVGPITPTTGSDAFSSIIKNSFLISSPRRSTTGSNRNRRTRHRLVVASSSWSSSAAAAAINGEPDHYKVLGVAQSATLADIKRAYRLLARKYHPDVSKDSRAVEVFKTIRCAYEVLSNEVTRIKYDRALKFRTDSDRSRRGNRRYSSEFEDGVRISTWAELRRKLQYERYWKNYNSKEEYSSFYRKAPVREVQEENPDGGYKIGYLIAWILGGRGGILLTLCLSFASWVCGKTSSGVVVLVVVAVWIGSNLARCAPLPQGALIALLYMSLKLQTDSS